MVRLKILWTKIFRKNW